MLGPDTEPWDAHSVWKYGSYKMDNVYCLALTPFTTRAVFFTGNISYQDREGNPIPWKESGDNEYEEIVPENADCDCPDWMDPCPTDDPDYCETVEVLSKVSAEKARDVMVQVLPYELIGEDEGPTPFTDIKAVRPPLAGSTSAAPASPAPTVSIKSLLS